MKIDIDELKKIAQMAGEAIMKIYNTNFDVEYKDDNSPLTIADTTAHNIISKSLNALYSDVPLLSEEGEIAPYSVRKKWKSYFCIDPIDGTKEFIKKNGEFSVNIAYLEDNIPLLGVIYAPATNELYWCDGKNSYKNDSLLPLEKDGSSFKIVTSRSHPSSKTAELIEKLVSEHKNAKILYRGSSLKFCMLAEGKADIYPRLAPTMEWDSAAADAILRCVGKYIYIYDGLKNDQPLLYNKKNLLNPRFVAR